MPPTHCPTLFQNLWFNKLINNPPCVHRYKEGYRMSVHSHRYRGRFSGGRQMAPALSPSWLNFFPGDISASGVILVLVAPDSSSVCSLHPAGLRKLCLLSPCIQVLWSAFCEHQQPSFPFLSIPALSCKLPIFLYLSLSCPSSLLRTLYLYHPGSLTVYIIAIYNWLIHLWLFHLTLIRLWWSAASCLISYTGVKNGLKGPNLP